MSPAPGRLAGITVPRRWRPTPPRRFVAAAAVAAVLGSLLHLPFTQAALAADVDCSTVPWMDKTKTADERAHALLAASTLDQKLRWLDEQSANNPQQTTFRNSRPRELPSDAPWPIYTFTMPAQLPCTPTIQYADGPGYLVAGSGVTYFPAPIANAAAWNAPLQFEKGAAVGDEAWRKQRTVMLAPGVSSARDPRAGRTSEYLGEDPLLSGILAGANSTGISSNPAQPVESQIKHYVANEQEIDRALSSSNVDARTLRETYTLPFEIAIDRGNLSSVMCSFNQVNHDWACGNHETLTQILKTEIGFAGFVVTDFGSGHTLSANPPSLRAGLDQELNAWREWTPDLIKEQIALGRLAEADVDGAALRVVRAHIAAGLFDVPRPAVSQDVVTTDAHQAVAQAIAEQGSVLLKNDGVLPLTGGGRRIAVIGQTASSTPTQVGNAAISAASVCTYNQFGGSPCAGSVVSPLDGITARATAAGDTVLYHNGSDPAAAAATAANADVAVVLGYYREGEGSDRADLSLEGNGDALINAVSAANKNTVVVLQTGGPVLMPWLGSVRGVLETWYAGQRMGPAIARLLYGDVNPSGKLPLSFPKSLADLPTAGSAKQYPGVFADGSTTRPAGSTEIRQVDYTEGMKVGYRWYAAQGITPLFPFGYGLSYSEFRYSHLQTTPSTTNASKEIRIRFRLTNTGGRTATETAQAYVDLPAAADEPSKRLVGWQQVTLAPGEFRNVEITLSAADLADLHLLQYWNTASRTWQTAEGEYGISVGGSFDTPLHDTIRIHHAG